MAFPAAENARSDRSTPVHRQSGSRRRSPTASQVAPLVLLTWDTSENCFDLVPVGRVPDVMLHVGLVELPQPPGLRERRHPLTHLQLRDDEPPMTHTEQVGKAGVTLDGGTPALAG